MRTLHIPVSPTDGGRMVSDRAKSAGRGLRLRRFRATTCALLVAAVCLSTFAALSAEASDVKPVSLVGRVVHVADGDTLDVDVQGDATTRPIRVRLTGINAMELTRYSNDPQKWRGECHAVAAARRLYSLVYGKTVRLTAQDARSRSGQRYRRRVWVYTGGVWRDVALILLAEGHGLFLPNGTEYAPNQAAATAARDAASHGRGLWDTDACGSGPAQAADLHVEVAWDAPGDDAVNPNGEYIKVSNHSPYSVDLSGWWVRDSAARGYRQRGFVFPAGTRLRAGGAVYVHPGHGTNTPLNLYWRIGSPVFENATGSPTYMGDGGYLFDPQGDLRAWQQYG